jgi:hypothetical protein
MHAIRMTFRDQRWIGIQQDPGTPGMHQWHDPLRQAAEITFPQQWLAQLDKAGPGLKR